MTRVCKHCGTSIEGALQIRIYCGKPCAAHASRNKRHGLSGTKEHATWLDMRNRCRNPNYYNYARYGARGIQICERWEVFENFLADMGSHPGKGFSIDRIDNDGNYEPSNCRWATKLEQSRNRSGVYTAEEDQTIRDGISCGLSFPEIARLMNKSTGAISTRAYRIGLSSGRRTRVTSTERCDGADDLEHLDGMLDDRERG